MLFSLYGVCLEDKEYFICIIVHAQGIMQTYTIHSCGALDNFRKYLYPIIPPKEEMLIAFNSIKYFLLHTWHFSSRLFQFPIYQKLEVTSVINQWNISVGELKVIKQSLPKLPCVVNYTRDLDYISQRYWSQCRKVYNYYWLTTWPWSRELGKFQKHTYDNEKPIIIRT